jgi:hypothetical protein
LIAITVTIIVTESEKARAFWSLPADSWVRGVSQRIVKPSGEENSRDFGRTVSQHGRRREYHLRNQARSLPRGYGPVHGLGLVPSSGSSAKHRHRPAGLGRRIRSATAEFGMMHVVGRSAEFAKWLPRFRTMLGGASARIEGR